MLDFEIRKFTHKDVEDFIRVAESAFADEWITDGMTPDAFARQTRKIFRWKMMPFKLLTALMGVQWEAFVAEVNGRVVGGGMYSGRKKHITLRYLMVEPPYRRQGVGQALLLKRLEQLSQQGIPFVTVDVLETNQASLGNLHKQGFAEYNRCSIYERSLPVPDGKSEHIVNARPLRDSDKALFRETEKKIMSSFVLHHEGAESDYFPSLGSKLYRRYAGSRSLQWAFDVDGTTVGFLAANNSRPMNKGIISQPVIASENMLYLPAILQQAGVWMESLGLEAVKINVLDHLSDLTDYLLDTGWEKKRTWLHLVKWLDEKAKQEFAFES